MTVTFWGARHYAKCYMVGLFRYNRKTVTRMTIGGEYSSHKYEYHGVDQHYIKYYRFTGDNSLSSVRKVRPLSSEQLLSHPQDEGLKIKYFVEDDWMGYGKFNPPLSNKIFKSNVLANSGGQELYPMYADHGSKWHDHFFNDLSTCDLFCPQPHKQLFEYEPFIDYFKSCNNIVPYKTNIEQITIARINQFVPAATNKTFNVNIKNVEDAYYTDKELVFKHLDDFTRNNRDVEQKLIDKGIEFDYLDLDNHDSRMFCENKLPKTYSLFTFDKESDRYKLAVKMAKDYIQTRNLTDTRLSGRINDKI